VTETPSPSPTPGIPHWESAGDTNVERLDARAVALSSGRLLVLGNSHGSDGIQVPLSGEVWDPGTGVWTEIDDLNNPRSDFAAVALANDQVLVAGGLNGEEPQQSYSSAYIYDARPGHEGWTKTGLMSVARTGPSAATLPDGRVLVAGGYFHVAPVGLSGGAAVLAAYDPAANEGPESADVALFDIDMGSAGAALATAEVFDPATGVWTPTGPMNYARHGAAAVTLSDGRVLIVGSLGESNGFTVSADEHAYDTAEIYDPATGRFTLAGELPDIDRAALEAGGEPGANPMPGDPGAVLNIGTLVPLQDGGALLVGQTRWWKHEADMTRSFRFDAAAGTWSEFGQPWVFVGQTGVPLTTPGVRNLSGAMVAAMQDGRVLIAGGGGNSPDGLGGRHADNVSELYDPATNEWLALPPMPVGRLGGAVAVIADGSVVLVGGLADPEEQTMLTSAVRLVP
jgi:hypothetical protein